MKVCLDRNIPRFPDRKPIDRSHIVGIEVTMIVDLARPERWNRLDRPMPACIGETSVEAKLKGRVTRTWLGDTGLPEQRTFSKCFG